MALVAGELSGDNLGAAFIRAVRRQVPDARFFGIAGPRMQAEGCEAWEPAESLAVMGLFEVLSHLPRLFALRRRIRERILAERPDVFVGIDAPEFNLNLAPALHEAGIPTVQYVSPQVWAWRQGRVGRMGRFLDLVLCLLPFEKRFYDEHGLAAEFVGHPLADQVPFAPDRAAARSALGLPAEGEVVAVLPGSRRGEVTRLAGDFAGAVALLAARRPGIAFVAPMASAEARAVFEPALEAAAPGAKVLLTEGNAQRALAAADVVLVASGTATLETLLCKRPMVVAYRLGALTAWLLRSFGLMKAPFFAQPNLLAGRGVVPEIFQEQVTAERLAAELGRWLDAPAGREALVGTFEDIHRQLRRDASARAAEAVLRLVAQKGSVPVSGERA
ncbi:MAG: lipid-A-disaccharide synthase [Steroidobacteraceae bacterium]|nr:lipid-A-disaccharide synthase [Steroidobacteraceae bacterium]